MTPEERRLQLGLRRTTASIRNCSSPESQDSEVSAEPQLIEMKLERLLKKPSKSRDRGLVTQAGEALDYALSSDPINVVLMPLQQG